MNILETIVEQKREEVYLQKIMVPVDEVVKSIYFQKPCFSLVNALRSGKTTNIIAEFKRRSPSKGFINQHADVASVTSDYTNFGAAGLSVLTDHKFFGGNTQDFVTARENNIPILRKDFIIDSYQLLATKAMGADVVLLIAAILSKEEVFTLASAAKELGMEVLLEIHDESELQHICDEVDMVGINNRNLKTFQVDIENAITLSKHLPDGKLKIAESGINSLETLMRLKKEGFDGFLMGETFMKMGNPGEAFGTFADNLKKY